jgi:hypothetical protein
VAAVSAFIGWEHDPSRTGRSEIWMPETVVAIEISDGGYVTDFMLVHGVARHLVLGAGTQEFAAAIDSAISSPADTVLVAHSASELVAPIVAGRRGVCEPRMAGP